MGLALATRLLEQGHDVAVYNRTRAKAEPLAELGATIVDSPAELGDRDIVFTIVAGPSDFKQIVTGPEGVLSGDGHHPSVIVDSTTIDAEASAVVRAAAQERGTALLAAPVSGNPKVVKAGRLTMATSGPRQAHDLALPYLEIMAGGGVTYVGEGERARLVKVCHNLMLGIVAQTMAEILVPTFTPPLLLKDFDLGYEAARELEVPMPVAAAAQQVVQALIGHGYTDVDFASLIALQAKASGLDLEPEGAPVSDGLERAA
jgi:3-hydroxyisobutyrate dehydrogenase-like beta-hydroxyacid dehydrogenase